MHAITPFFVRIALVLARTASAIGTPFGEAAVTTGSGSATPTSSLAELTTWLSDPALGRLSFSRVFRHDLDVQSESPGCEDRKPSTAKSTAIWNRLVYIWHQQHHHPGPFVYFTSHQPIDLGSEHLNQHTSASDFWTDFGLPLSTWVDICLPQQVDTCLACEILYHLSMGNGTRSTFLQESTFTTSFMVNWKFLLKQICQPDYVYLGLPWSQFQCIGRQMLFYRLRNVTQGDGVVPKTTGDMTYSSTCNSCLAIHGSVQ
ncbi:hypothetical protein DFH07DRAFT_773857 [Mycena maculata]|uniref:Uncharacterized protein n=1 Tax=Mycena maculata TaxID=230809 RepID=A0AAD7J021_9AGAR|nr:hypothetical protein DFH07DRAFT_773857 [Mycena maculata]